MGVQPFVRVLGSADWQQTAGNDGTCFTLSDRILIDTGSAAGMTLLNEGIDPLQMNTICFTHMHCDHCIGLFQWLLYWGIKYDTLENLTIMGPAATVREHVEKVFQFVWNDTPGIPLTMTRPTIVELKNGDRFETEDYYGEVIDSDHSVPGLCYRFTHKETGKSACFSGDTRYLEIFPAFFRKTDLLIYEASWGGGPLDPISNASCRHSSGREAAMAAERAQVKQLILAHAYEPKRNAAVAAARECTSIPVNWAIPLQVFPI